MNNKQPNILIIMADQLTPFALGCYGNNIVHSPNIDRLANEGVRFDAAYCNSPLCTPGRYAFMTGQYVSHCGGYDNAAYLPTNVPTFAHYLRNTGYKTTLSGKMHFVGVDQLHGFERRLTTDIYPADFGWVPDWRLDSDERIDLWYHNMSSVKQAGVAAITNQLAYDDEVGAQSLRSIYDNARQTDERPFCLVASFIHPHDPYATRQQYWDLYQHDVIDLPTVGRPDDSDLDPHSRRLQKAIALDAVDLDENDIRNARRAYYGNVSYVDEWVGRLRFALEETGQADNTVIVLLADHGDMLGERGLWYKMSFYEWSVCIPMIIHAPKYFTDSVVSQPVSQVDILPTLVDIASDNPAEPAQAIDGTSLWSLCHGDDGGPDCAVSEYLAEGTNAPLLMIRKDEYKYTCCPTDPEQLFNLETDANELNNIAKVPEQAEILDAFREQAGTHWDVDDIHARVLEDQELRRFLNRSLRQGVYTSWDFQPGHNAAEEYTRSHLELTEFDYASRWPRTPEFKPRYT
ncbi:MAG: choline-sulfatase [Gammaproteobacteria bacterium]|nr:choline-sulfatase [Gammaproteobacteria bacterium]